MSKCFVGVWYDELDTDDTVEFERAADEYSRIRLYELILEAAQLEGKPKPFSLTTLKDHLLTHCVCYREV